MGNTSHHEHACSAVGKPHKVSQFPRELHRILGASMPSTTVYFASNRVTTGPATQRQSYSGGAASGGDDDPLWSGLDVIDQQAGGRQRLEALIYHRRASTSGLPTKSSVPAPKLSQSPLIGIDPNGGSCPIVFSNGSRDGDSVMSEIGACRVSAFSTCSCGT
jgi:hypothetical protein